MFFQSRSWDKPGYLAVTLRLCALVLPWDCFYLMPERHEVAESQGNCVKDFWDRSMFKTWLTVEKHLVYLTQNGFKQRFPLLAFWSLRHWRALGVFFKAFYVVNTVYLPWDCWRWSIQENNLFSVQTGHEKVKHPVSTIPLVALIIIMHFLQKLNYL